MVVNFFLRLPITSLYSQLLIRTLVQNINNMALTLKQKLAIRKLTIEEKVEILHEIADEFMTVEEFHEISKIPKRTIYDKFGTETIKGVEFCGHKLIYI